MSSADLKSLFQIAKSANAVEIIYAGRNRNTHQSNKYAAQTFRYIIVMDFEATCWPKETQQWKTHEIIEFPAVLLNLSNGKIESEFRQYVMPIENPRLSDFCMALTGIRQQDVDSGVPLHTCLSLFDKWLKQILFERKLSLPKTNSNNQNGNVAFATWSDWDFGSCLSRECARKKTKKPSYFDQWIDVRAVYRKFYQHRPQSFQDALDKLGLRFKGRPHSGLDDSRNLSKIIATMCKDGANFTITKDLRPFELIRE